jgi:hypothetical protein
MENLIDPVLQFITSHQETDGSFPTYESYPVVNPAAGWTKLPDSSPFITANILFSLMQLKDAMLDTVVQKGVKSLISIKEGNGFWRFWPVKSKQHPVPLDMDDTCIVRYILTRYGHRFDNDKVLLNNKNKEGYFETWLKPRFSYLWIAPEEGAGFLKDYIIARPTQKLKHFAYNDKEPAVAANALLYFGENEHTKACIDLMIAELKSTTITKQFYEDDIVVYYHIARAFANGVQSFGELGTIIANKILARFNSETSSINDMLSAMAANVLLDYKTETAQAQKLIDSIAQGKSFPDKWQSHAYFCSKDRNFLSGSPGLTAAVFVEACSKLKRPKEK